MSSEILICQNQAGNIKTAIRLEKETVWLAQAQIVQLQRTISTYE